MNTGWACLSCVILALALNLLNMTFIYYIFTLYTKCILDIYILELKHAMVLSLPNFKQWLSTVLDHPCLNQCHSGALEILEGACTHQFVKLRTESVVISH